MLKKIVLRSIYSMQNFEMYVQAFIHSRIDRFNLNRL